MLKKVTKKVGLVEQAQIVASTAVIVSMVTILSAMAATGQALRLMDFISILTVGLIGFASVFFSLQYSRQLDEKRRELLAVNTVAESVNRVVDLDFVLRTALEKATDILDLQYGWVYTIEEGATRLRCSKGTSEDFVQLTRQSGDDPMTWLPRPYMRHERLGDRTGTFAPTLKSLRMQSWASVPLFVKDSLSGALIVGGEQYEMITSKQVELLSAFANQISIAMHNAMLFDQLRRSEQRYADLFENSPDIYFSVTRDHIVVTGNAVGLAALGYKHQEIPGRQFESFFPEEHHANIHRRLTDMFTELRELKNVETVMVRKSGEVFDANLNSTLVLDDKGAPVSARIVARDTSERKKMEATLLHAQKIESIGNLAGGIAHDFNNILSSVLGAASILRRKVAENDSHAKYVEIITTAAHRGASLTRQLLTFARKTETIVDTISINDIVVETLDLFTRGVGRDIEIVTDLSSEEIQISGDASQLQQALLNLFMNARDAMSGGGTLTVVTRATTLGAHSLPQFTSIRPGPFAEILVTDTGVGMDSVTQSRIFEPFFSTKELRSGLGLSVLYGVVQNHAGYVTLQSTPGRGTGFTIYLPRLSAAVSSMRKDRSSRMPRGSENVLIIDDELAVCEIARDMLLELGYSVTVVHNGKAGIEAYLERRDAIGIVLLDVNMPVMGGVEAFQHLRRFNPELPILIITGYGKNTVEASQFGGYIHGFLQKPFLMEELALKVRQALDTQVPQLRKSS